MCVRDQRWRVFDGSAGDVRGKPENIVRPCDVVQKWVLDRRNIKN